jgi:hypothetical protein
MYAHQEQTVLLCLLVDHWRQYLALVFGLEFRLLSIQNDVSGFQAVVTGDCSLPYIVGGLRTESLETRGPMSCKVTLHGNKTVSFRTAQG